MKIQLEDSDIAAIAKGVVDLLKAEGGKVTAKPSEAPVKPATKPAGKATAKDAAKEPEKPAEDKPEEGTEEHANAKVIKLPAVIEALRAHAKANSKQSAQDILKKYTQGSAADVKEEDYAALIADLEGNDAPEVPEPEDNGYGF
jgi:ribosomal protein L12E/L44/L45/RPP1/RPP2